jgi:hypothetical protein
VQSELDRGVEPVLGDGEAQLVPSVPLTSCHRLVAEVLEHVTAPPPEGLTCRGVGPFEAPCLPVLPHVAGLTSELGGIQSVRFELQRVAGHARDQQPRRRPHRPVGFQHASELGDVRLHRGGDTGWWVLAPQLVGQTVDRDARATAW